ncbi:MAG: M48 family metallopeptidase [Succinivibrio sp.]|nr:M48 family metallopeptidase [Succinivibrio sp.]
MIKRTLLTLAICAGFSCICQSAVSANISLPDIGTAGAQGITVQREQQIGQYFMRNARAQMPVLDDPALNEYVTSVGNNLVLHANNVHFPFEFFVVLSPQLNASAFLGGKIMVNTGLLHYSRNADEFASVLAHEVSHVTQRHIARFIENQLKMNTVTIAGLIGSIAMAIINPMAGAAALSTTMGVSTQASINFTRENETEADAIGIDLLYRSGYDPTGMVSMFKTLLDRQGNLNPMFAMLIDHPLSEVRVAQAQNRTMQYPKRKPTHDADFELAKARVDVRYMNANLEDLKRLLQSSGTEFSQIYRTYALALICYEMKNYQEARTYLGKLQNLSGNIFVLDLLTDLDIQEHQFSRAIERLKAHYRNKPNNEAICINLANTMILDGRNKEAVQILSKFSKKHPNNTLALDLLATAQNKMHNRCEALQSKGMEYALKANYSRAVNLLNDAMNVCTDKYTRAVLQARITEVNEQRRFDESLNKGL